MVGLSIACALATASKASADDLDCSLWVRDREQRDGSLVHLGMTLSKIARSYHVTKTSSKPVVRAHDGLIVHEYKTAQVVGGHNNLEVLECSPENGVVVGILNAELIGFGEIPIQDWIRTYERELRQKVKGLVASEWRGKGFYLWGYKPDPPALAPGQIAERVILRRRCQSHETSKGLICGMTSSEAYRYRSVIWQD